jgi:hypothetical protein
MRMRKKAKEPPDGKTGTIIVRENPLHHSAGKLAPGCCGKTRTKLLQASSGLIRLTHESGRAGLAVVIATALQTEEEALENRHTSEPKQNSDLWAFVHTLKSDSIFAGLTADDAYTIVTEFFRQRDAESDEEDVWENAFPFVVGSPASRFMKAWDKVCHPAGSLNAAVAKAAQSPIIDQAVKPNGYRRFLDVLFHLTDADPGKGFFLAQSAFAAQLGRDRETVGDYIRLAVSTGLLILISRGSYTSGRASEYKINPERFEAILRRPIESHRKEK